MQRIRNAVGDTDNTTVAIVTVGFVLLLIILLPQVIPGGRFGVSCSALANPIPGGNNQSLLSARAEGTLGLEISLPQIDVPINSSLLVNATFVNNSIGAITLFLVPRESLLRDDGTAGLNFVIRRLPDQTVVSEPVTIRPPNPQRTQFSAETLHILGPRQRCTEQIEFTTVRLSNLGLAPGQYSIQAIYRNPYPGTLDFPPAPTPTPIFPNQGVYTTQELRSNTVTFNIVTAATVTQPAEAEPLGG